MKSTTSSSTSSLPPDAQEIFCKCCRQKTAHMDMQHLPGKVRLFKCKVCGEYNNDNDNNDNEVGLQVAGAFAEYPPLLILPGLLRGLVIFRMKSRVLSAQEIVSWGLSWGPEDFDQINRLIDLLEHFGVNEFGDLENLFKEYM